MRRSVIVTSLFGLLSLLLTVSHNPSEAKWARALGNFLPPRESFDAGESLNIFSSYGYLREGFHILPTNSNEPWVIKTPTHNPLKNVPIRNGTLNHKGDIELQFCAGPKQLLIAYFRHFSIDGIPKVWNSFLIGWDRETFAKWMGIKKHFLSNAYSYVLVRIIRREKVGSLAMREEGPSLTTSAEEDVWRIAVGDEASVLRFFEKHGTHYVNRYTTGGLMYQVYAYSRKKYTKIMSEFKKKEIEEWPSHFFDFVFSPWYSDHSGNIMVASGNSTIRHWIQQNLNARFFIYTHQSLLNVYRNQTLMQELATLLGDDVIIQMDLKTLVPAIRDQEKRSWVEEILMNRLTLWDVGL